MVRRDPEGVAVLDAGSTRHPLPDRSWNSSNWAFTAVMGAHQGFPGKHVFRPCVVTGTYLFLLAIAFACMLNHILLIYGYMYVPVSCE